MKKVFDKVIRVGFVGNPNCGKTTLFNAFTGAKLKVANWPGVTVEKVEGEADYKGTHMQLVDLPGIYSLTSYTLEEKVSRKCILNKEVDVIINVVDASCLERNLYLTLQLLELGVPVVLALNMMDIVEERGMSIDLHRLPEMLGNIPVVPVSARKRTGLDMLLHAVKHHYEEAVNGRVFDYDAKLESRMERLSNILRKKYPQMENYRWHAIKLLEKDEEVSREYLSLEMQDIIGNGYEKQLIAQKYEYIETIIEDTVFNRAEKEEKTDRVDRILTHKIWGIPIFLCIMAFVFFLTFTVGDWLKGYFEIGLEWFSGAVSEFLAMIHVNEVLLSLIVDGIIAGVGGILTFLPNLIILFLALAVLEDSGYMARVAFVMEEIMSKAGLSGKAFLPMILGFGCTVPAVMATRSLEHERDRKKVMLLVPFMSCSAKLPVYVLFAEMFFGRYAMIAAFSLYVLGMILAIVIAVIMGKVTGNKENNTLLIELPEYKSPNIRTISIYMWEKVKDYLSKAGTTIFIASIILWFVLNFGFAGMTGNVEQSFGADIGRILVPLLYPAGLGMWQVAVALISGLSAKEVVVSSFSVLFGIGNINSSEGMSTLAAALAAEGFGMANACALLVFCLLYTPCMAAVGTIKKEAGWKFTIHLVIFQLVFAWVMAWITFHAAGLFL